jgi:hypothetical protein
MLTDRKARSDSSAMHEDTCQSNVGEASCLHESLASLDAVIADISPLIRCHLR